MTIDVPSADEYGARFAGFVVRFITTFNEKVHTPLPGPDVIVGTPDPRSQLFHAAVAAWEDYLVRQRRVDTNRDRDSRTGGGSP